MIRPFIVLMLILLLSGCSTTTRGFVKYIERNPDLAPSQADKAFGSPVNIQHLSNRIQYRVYEIYPEWISYPKDIAVYFIDDKFYRYGEDNDFFHLSIARDLEIISKEQYANLSNELNERRKALIPLVGLIQQNNYQNRLLEVQQEQLKLQRESQHQPTKKCYTSCSPTVYHGDGTTSGANCTTECR